MRAIDQTSIETGVDSREIHEQCANKQVLVNVAAENNRYLNNLLLFIHGLACFFSRLYDICVILQKQTLRRWKLTQEKLKL